MIVSPGSGTWQTTDPCSFPLSLMRMGSSNLMNKGEWHIYLGKIPYNKEGNFWVSFESDPRLRKTKENIYGRCLPCIQNLYRQLKAGCTEITLGPAYNCWKITAVLDSIDQCLALLSEFEKEFPTGHVYGKIGSGRPDSDSKVVVFHAEDVAERDRVRETLGECLLKINPQSSVQISRACAVLYHDILGDWRSWNQTAMIEHPENREKVLKRIKDMLFLAGS